MTIRHSEGAQSATMGIPCEEANPFITYFRKAATKARNASSEEASTRY